MDMESTMKLIQAFMSADSSDSPDDGTDENAGDNAGEDSTGENENTDKGDNSGGGEGDNSSDGFNFFDGINIEMIMKLGELFSQMNKPDINTELLLALKPHLKEENRHKVDSAVKLSRMLSLLPLLKESGILNGLNLF